MYFTFQEKENNVTNAKLKMALQQYLVPPELLKTKRDNQLQILQYSLYLLHDM